MSFAFDESLHRRSESVPVSVPRAAHRTAEPLTVDIQPLMSPELIFEMSPIDLEEGEYEWSPSSTYAEEWSQERRIRCPLAQFPLVHAPPRFPFLHSSSPPPSPECTGSGKDNIKIARNGILVGTSAIVTVTGLSPMRDGDDPHVSCGHASSACACAHPSSGRCTRQPAYTHRVTCTSASELRPQEGVCEDGASIYSSLDAVPSFTLSSRSSSSSSRPPSSSASSGGFLSHRTSYDRLSSYSNSSVLSFSPWVLHPVHPRKWDLAASPVERPGGALKFDDAELLTSHNAMDAKKLALFLRFEEPAPLKTPGSNVAQSRSRPAHSPAFVVVDSPNVAAQLVSRGRKPRLMAW
ncbi:hypothetical protein FISHEDRAFT_75490 [Fistulina hepatica ATCC 64428]|uniref:Uncharacterized protein n=1 Tax=Fistulina hepatica ATCC 64428 TaxID=1128425 RepID=A0A0D7A6Y6_9AGAR|nr:hypothetical protein FISHEDRAFT_75490 [Fistulina hepatica ATCC 64428]